LILVLAFLVMLSTSAFARTRVERYMDVSGNGYYAANDKYSWSASVAGDLRFWFGGWSDLDTTLSLTTGKTKNGATITNAANQQLKLIMNYQYYLGEVLGKFSTWSLYFAPSTTKGDNIGFTQADFSSSTEFNTKFNMAVTRRLDWKIGYASLQGNWFETRFTYTKPIGKYLSKANLVELLMLRIGEDTGGNFTWKPYTGTVLDYTLYKRITLQIVANFEWNNRLGFGAPSYKELTTSILYRFY